MNAAAILITLLATAPVAEASATETLSDDCDGVYVGTPVHDVCVNPPPCPLGLPPWVCDIVESITPNP